LQKSELEKRLDPFYYVPELLELEKKVLAGDLLVKITGVGRMAVASVVPDGFEDNINQHVCVIKTGSKEISETLAAFLNSDIGEKLASQTKRNRQSYYSHQEASPTIERQNKSSIGLGKQGN